MDSCTHFSWVLEAESLGEEENTHLAFSRYRWASLQSVRAILSSYCRVKAWAACCMTSNKSSTKELDKQSNFIQKASKQRRWQTSVLKRHLEKVHNSGFFYVRRRDGRCLKSGSDWRLQTSGRHRGLERDGETSLLLANTFQLLWSQSWGSYKPLIITTCPHTILISLGGSFRHGGCSSNS